MHGIRISAAAVAITLLAGCGGTTVPGAVPTPPPVAAVSHQPARTATPSATPAEERIFEEGPPPLAYRTQAGAAMLHVRRYSWQRTANGQQAAPPQQAYVVLDLKIIATEGRVPVNPLYFAARTATQTFAPTLGADGNEPVLASAELGTKEAAEGIIVFDAPPTQLILQINDELGRKVGEIVIPAPEVPMEIPEPPQTPDQPAPADPGERPDAAQQPTDAPEQPAEAPEEQGGTEAEAGDANDPLQASGEQAAAPGAAAEGH